MQLLRGGERSGEIFFAHDNRNPHSQLRKEGPQIRIAEHHASGSVAIDVVGQENAGRRAHQFRMFAAEAITEPAGGLKSHESFETF